MCLFVVSERFWCRGRVLRSRVGGGILRSISTRLELAGFGLVCVVTYLQCGYGLAGVSGDI